MIEENKNTNCDCQSNCDRGGCCSKKVSRGCGATGGCVYGVALIGALVFYIQQAETFGQGALGVLKAIVWPALLVYQLLEFLVK